MAGVWVGSHLATPGGPKVEGKRHICPHPHPSPSWYQDGPPPSDLPGIASSLPSLSIHTYWVFILTHPSRSSPSPRVSPTAHLLFIEERGKVVVVRAHNLSMGGSQGSPPRHGKGPDSIVGKWEGALAPEGSASRPRP